MSNSFRSNWLATTALTAGFLAIAMTGALAQDKPDSADDSVETVTVTGFRGSLLKAIDLKHDAVGSQDSIVADDIAAFPDLNLAEALQRIPGIAITRDSGEGRQIVLRGLGPDFTRTQVNGMESAEQHRLGHGQSRRRQPHAQLRFQPLRLGIVRQGDGAEILRRRPGRGRHRRHGAARYRQAVRL